MTDIYTPLASTIINSIIGLWYIIPIILIIGFFKSSYFKGRLGEAFVNLSIDRKLDKKNYHLIKDATLPTEDGTTQVDHIVVSKFGIFVVETKNMKGWIFGGEHQKTWTQSIYSHKNKFQNPLHQNYKHIKTLEKLLDLSNDKFHSVIVFVGESTFKTKMPENVIKGQYTHYIKSKKEVLFTPDEVNEITHKIETSRYERGFITNRKHIQHLKRDIQKREDSLLDKKI